ncbi:MAG: Cys-tRNA(Pro) deacylase [Planctomycetia bacterium]|nr:Cys-tRNA(Pro) deacylase [Planctomycetia bacterium]
MSSHSSSNHASEKTNVTRLLDAAQIPYSVQAYEVDPDDLSGMHIVEQLQCEPERLFKTLVMKGEKNGYFVCCLAVCDELDLKKVAKAFGDKKCDLIPMKELKDLTGYIRGGCSPIGMKKKFPTFIDETSILFEQIYVNAGQRGLMILLSPSDLARYVDATVCDLVKN